MGTRKSSNVIRRILAQDVLSENQNCRAKSSLTRFIVSVPVLSLQMVVADPMVSHAASFLTRALSSIILCIEYAKLQKQRETVMVVGPLTSMGVIAAAKLKKVVYTHDVLRKTKQSRQAYPRSAENSSVEFLLGEQPTGHVVS